MELRCICHNLSFRGLLAYARRRDITTVDALMQATQCGTACGTCRPYLARMLETGVVPTVESVQAEADAASRSADSQAANSQGGASDS